MFKIKMVEFTGSEENISLFSTLTSSLPNPDPASVLSSLQRRPSAGQTSLRSGQHPAPPQLSLVDPGKDRPTTTTTHSNFHGLESALTLLVLELSGQVLTAGPSSAPAAHTWAPAPRVLTLQTQGVCCHQSPSSGAGPSHEMLRAPSPTAA